MGIDTRERCGVAQKRTSELNAYSLDLAHDRAGIRNAATRLEAGRRGEARITKAETPAESPAGSATASGLRPRRRSPQEGRERPR